ncbi:low specificity L-threonine aldolase [Jannaschia sp. 2305UL9-9]|uniref:threonine aldolase family protein n=1 Tax=Jannaschia sp. 2305UL9-9 TaxID=3121638 RepID=UPI00352952FF
MNLNFASDNTGPVAAPVMAAIQAANTGAAMPYGADPWMPQVRDRLRDLFDWPEAEVLLVTTGTAANAIALAALVQPWQTIFAHRTAHIEADECGAPEFFTAGAKLTLLDGPDGQITPAAFEAALSRLGGQDVHSVQPGALSLTNVTETGSVYSLETLGTLTDMARAAGIPTHLDGARFANACAALDCSAAAMVRGFDAVSFGGTKNGCMGVEAIVIRNPAKAWELALRRKRAGHLWSKNRFLSAQMLAYLTDDLWRANANAANAAGQRLRSGLAASGAEVTGAPAANMVFARLSKDVIARAQKSSQFYTMDTADHPLCRFVCDFTKTADEVDALLDLIAG